MTIATEALPALYRRIAHFSQGEMDPELVFHLAFARAGMQAEADAALARAAPHDATARFIAAPSITDAFNTNSHFCLTLVGFFGSLAEGVLALERH
ncbi:MAG: hypothetical protein R3F61_26100 [Myxococcota bacterium]